MLLITLTCCMLSIGSKSFPHNHLLPHLCSLSGFFFLQDLGLSTGRGRGHCKNQSCDYMYKNRHKPAVCPKCGCELSQKNAKGTKVKVVLLQRLQNQSAAVCHVVFFSAHDAATLFLSFSHSLDYLPLHRNKRQTFLVIRFGLLVISQLAFFFSRCPCRYLIRTRP